MKIALIQCPVWGTYDPPVALAQLSACLKRDGHEVYALDLNIELYLNRKESYKDMWAWEQCGFWYDSSHVLKFFAANQDSIGQYMNRILESKSRIACFSVSTSSRLASLELARLIKKENKDILIAFGGTLFFEKDWIEAILNETAVDIVAYGEGEVTLCELIRLLEENKPLDSCLGISFKTNNKIFNNPSRPLIDDLDNLPFMDFLDLPLCNYDDAYHIPFLASRGCIQQCVFCSSRVFWPGYRRMSGARIFQEIVFHKNSNSALGHVDFLDLMFNGDIKALGSFCDLMVNSDLKGSIAWIANVIVRPEMTPELLRKMKEAGCKHLIYGIESGSQRVLDLMKKRYKIEDAYEVIKATHEAGIVVTANFMFGFPGEEEGDFIKTLDFIRSNAKYLDRVYPSRTFCALEEFSYLYIHREGLGIKPNSPNHLYWESTDGKNIYPERLRRCEEFCNLALSLGIEVASGVQTSVELDRWFNLANYYEHKKDIKNTLDCYLRYYELEPKNEIVVEKIVNYFAEIEEAHMELTLGSDLCLKLKKIVNSINAAGESNLQPIKRLKRIGREKSFAIGKAEQRDNLQLNDLEFNNKEVVLRSTPKAFFLQASGPCNSSCTFCSRGSDYEMFDLEIYRERFEEKLSFSLNRAEQIIFTGSGEFLQLPEAEKILDYFDLNFPQTNKMFSTNGSSLTYNICDKISRSKSKYTIHVSLHASMGQLHKVITRTDNFHKILGQLKYLLETRKDTGNPTIHLIFVATTLNIEDLPNFVRLAANLGVDKVVCYYNYIYVSAQKYLSCFFKQDLTNQMLDEAEGVANRLNMKIDLPPRFAQKEYPLFGICREPWSQVMLNLKGDVLPCDVFEDCNENLGNVEGFWNVWNGNYYHNLRNSLINGTGSCFKHCFRANPGSVNDFRSHVIHRGKKESEINILWGDNF
jgi:anaerobic magnesium-protoporphyrin IX monomethyl ester cyclase